MKVTHVNDVAHVGATLVTTAQQLGLPWDLWRLPAVRGRSVPHKVGARAKDAGRFARVGHRSDVLHVHYGLFGYYADMARRPYVLHLHGSDVRINLRSSATRSLVKRSLSHAARVVYSTPDLRAEVIRLRPDAEWLPAPVTQPGGPAPEREHDLVVFGSRWEPFKGSPALLAAARTLRARLPRARLVGIDWGIDAPLARAAGVELFDPLPHEDFRRLLARAAVLVGQVDSGSIGVTEIEALLAGTPVVTRFDLLGDYGTAPPVWNVDCDEGVVDAVSDILERPSAATARATTAPEWARGYHEPGRIVRRLDEMYAAVLAGSR